MPHVSDEDYARLTEYKEQVHALWRRWSLLEQAMIETLTPSQYEEVRARYAELSGQPKPPPKLRILLGRGAR
jgi:alkanesulfonate monooxygenase SsuD/methylene tetrahydromethanopterin reductase-like flavin-dependent oxidoreductase (luciferase family)